MLIHVSGFLVIFAMLLLIYDALNLYRRIFSKNLFFIASLFVFTAYFYYVLAFVVDDFSLMEVITHSTRGYPLWMKIGASWSGIGGSFFLWVFLLVIIAVLIRIHFTRTDKIADERPFLISLNLMIVGVSALSFISGAFDTLGFRPAYGLGLNPLLKSFWLITHPLFTFIAYASCIVLSLYVILSKSRSLFIERLLALVAWITLSIGIIAGGVWAYNVLGWGGYWAWDPVETAELVPWLALTAFFHTFNRVNEGGKKLTAALIGFFTIWSSFMTKVGANFTTSVHAFELSPVAMYILVLHLVLGGFILLLYLRNYEPIELSVGKKPIEISYVLAWLSLILLSFVTYLGLLVPILHFIVTGSRISVGPSYYNIGCFPFTIAFLVALIGCSIGERLNLKKFLIVITIPLALGVLFAILSFPTPNILANLGIPIGVLALVLTGYKFVHRLIRLDMRLLGVSMTHVAIPLILSAVFINSTTTQTISVNVPFNEYVETPFGYKIMYIGYESGLSDTQIIHRGSVIPEYAWGVFKFKISGASEHIVEIPVYVPFNYGCISEPRSIPKDTFNELYISIWHYDMHNRLRPAVIESAVYGNNVDITSITLEVKYNILINLVWVGVTLLVIGELIALFSALYMRRWKS